MNKPEGVEMQKKQNAEKVDPEEANGEVDDSDKNDSGNDTGEEGEDVDDPLSSNADRDESGETGLDAMDQGNENQKGMSLFLEYLFLYDNLI
jgi:hypothetical protein